jgi:hypothetical protein
MAPSDEKPSNFTVTDRRSFDASGEPKDDKDAVPAVPPTTTVPPEAKAAASKPESRPLPPADFPTLVLSLGSSAMMYLGESEGGQPGERNLPMAKHAIDLLTVLEEKTKGNLSADEDHLLESLLFDLRLRYVEALKASPAGG